MPRIRRTLHLAGLALVLLAARLHADPLDATTDLDTAPTALVGSAYAPDAADAADASDASDAHGAPYSSGPADAPSMDAADAADATDATDADVVPDLAPIPVAASLPPPPAVVPPPAVAPEPDLDVASYTMSARLDPQRHEVSAEGTLRWRNTSAAPVRDLWFHLYMNGYASERTLFMRTTEGVHRGNVRGRWGRIDLRRLRLATGEDLLAAASNDPAVPDDASQLHVPLPRAVAPGERIELAMAWTTVLPEVFARTGFHDRFHMVAQWFPKVAVLERDGRWAHFPFHGNTEFYADFGTYDVTLTVPHAWVVGACGQPAGPLERTPAGDRQRWVAARVHDFAFTAWDAFRERRATSGEVALRVLFPPGEEPAAERAIAALQRAMPVFARRFGEYPYPTLTVVFPPRGAEGAGGMEYPTLITTDGEWWVPGPARVIEYVVLHEFAHQYFYGLLASDENRWPFLDEGLAEYATCLGLDQLYGPGGDALDWLGARGDCYAWEAAESAGIGFPLPVAQGAAAFPTFGAYAAHVYTRTATVLRTAELTVGRARFADALALYTRRARFRHPTPEDLFSAVRDAAGDAVVDALLRPALTAPERLNYGVALVESHPADGHRWEGRAVIARAGTLELPVSIALEREDGVRTMTRWDGHGTTIEVPYSGPVALRAARVDPAGDIPLDENRLDNALTADDQTGPVFPLVARLAYWLGLALQVVGP